MARHMAVVGSGALDMVASEALERVEGLERDRDNWRGAHALAVEELRYETARAARIWRWAFSIGLCVGSLATFAVGAML